MTAYKPRDPGSLAEASCIIRDQFTAEGVAGIIHMSVSRVNQACDPDMPNYCPFTLAQARALDVAYKRATSKEGPLLIAYKRYYAEHTADLVEREVEPLFVIGDVSALSSKIVKELVSAHAPDSDGGETVTKAEGLKVVTEIDALVRELEGYRRHYAKIGGISPDMRPAGVARLNDNQSAA